MGYQNEYHNSWFHNKQNWKKLFTARVSNANTQSLCFSNSPTGFLRGLCRGSRCSFVWTNSVLLYVQMRAVVAVERSKEHYASSPLKSFGDFTKSKISRHKRKLFSKPPLFPWPQTHLPSNADLLWSFFQCSLTSFTFVHVSPSLGLFTERSHRALKYFPLIVILHSDVLSLHMLQTCCAWKSAVRVDDVSLSPLTLYSK